MGRPKGSKNRKCACITCGMNTKPTELQCEQCIARDKIKESTTQEQDNVIQFVRIFNREFTRESWLASVARFNSVRKTA